MELGLTKQQSSDLNFYLYRRALHPELFRICMDRHVDHGRYQADLWILGLSHLISFQTPSGIVTELAGASSDLLTDRNLVTQFKFRGERDFQFRFDDDTRYIFSSQVEDMSEHIFRTTYRDLARYAKKKGMFVPFKQWAVAGLEPFSFLDYETRDRELHLHAYHAFPGEWRILRTQSIFELSDAPRRVSAK